MSDKEPKLLFVDDEPNVLEGIRRSLFDDFDVYTAASGEEALKYLRSEGPFAVIVSDMRMPGMDGATVLTRARVLAPDTTRMLLTGYSEINAAIAAVNEGQIFRFLTKPCPKDALIRALRDGVAQNRLVTAEKELLEETLSGAVNVLVEVLGLAAPSVFSHAGEVKKTVAHIAKELAIPAPWRFELAAQLSQLGCVAVPPEIVTKAQRGEPLSEQEQQVYASHPETGYRLLSKIPRLGPVATAIREQMSETATEIADQEVQTGAEMLRVAVALRKEMQTGLSQTEAIAKLRATGRYDSRVVRSLDSLVLTGPERVIKMLALKELKPGMILEDNVVTPKGGIIVPSGREVTIALLDRLTNFVRGRGVVEPIKVSVET